MPPDPPSGCVDLVNLSSKTLDPPLAWVHGHLTDQKLNVHGGRAGVKIVGFYPTKILLL
jgi:hypothetical protein